MDFLAGVVSFLLTLVIFSYLIGDNFLFRLAIYVFVGLTAAFTTLVTVESVILPLLDEFGEIYLVLIASVITGLLLLKPIRRLTPLTNLALAFLVAVGAAVSVVGGITGTLLPLAIATGSVTVGNLINGLIVFVGVATSLFYFQYRVRLDADNVPQRGRFRQAVQTVGEGFIAVTLGALYGSAILTSLTILTSLIAQHIEFFS
jgi:hypothetical protein